MCSSLRPAHANRRLHVDFTTCHSVVARIPKMRPIETLVRFGLPTARDITFRFSYRVTVAMDRCTNVQKGARRQPIRKLFSYENNEILEILSGVDFDFWQPQHSKCHEKIASPHKWFDINQAVHLIGRARRRHLAYNSIHLICRWVRRTSPKIAKNVRIRRRWHENRLL